MSNFNDYLFDDMTDMINNWEFDDFLSFLLIHAAMADFVIADEEKDYILTKLPENKFKAAKFLHDKNSDIENIRIIQLFKDKYCNNPESREHVFKEVERIVFSDGDYNFFEKNMQRALHMLLD